MRKKTIEGFKDTVFGYSLKFGYFNSFNGDMFISKDNTILNIFANSQNYIYFESEEKAENYKKEILNKAKRFADNFNIMIIDNKGNDEKIQRWLNKHYDNKNIVSRIGGEMSEEGSGNKWSLEIVQVIKPEPLK